MIILVNNFVSSSLISRKYKLETLVCISEASSSNAHTFCCFVSLVLETENYPQDHFMHQTQEEAFEGLKKEKKVPHLE